LKTRILLSILGYIGFFNFFFMNDDVSLSNLARNWVYNLD